MVSPLDSCLSFGNQHGVVFFGTLLKVKRDVHSVMSAVKKNGLLPFTLNGLVSLNNSERSCTIDVFCLGNQGQNNL